MIRTPMFLLIITLIFLAGCQAEPGVKVEDFIGSWRYVGFDYQFKEDGTYSSSNPGEFGQFQLEGTLLTLTIADEASFCPGKIGTYEIELREDGKLHWVLREDECAPRGGYLAQPSLWSRPVDFCIRFPSLC